VLRIDPILSSLREHPFTRWLRRQPAWRAASYRVLAAWALLRRIWRRSLQFRVITITLVLASTLVAMFGFIVADIITNRVLSTKIEEAERQVEYGQAYATNQLKVVNQESDPALGATVPPVVAWLTAVTANVGEVDVVMLRTDLDLPVPAEQLSPRHEQAYHVARSLAKTRAILKEEPPQTSWRYYTGSLDGGPARQYLVFGTPVTTFGGDLELYYFFPLDDEVALVNSVNLTLVLTGITLVALLVLLAAVITRMVVKPVRVAARTAQRLSAGLLDQRMEVRGEDDLARLAAAFNQMAGNLQRQIIRLEEMSRVQRRFTSDVSHELRTPLTTVRMAADLIFSSREDFAAPVARSAELLQAELDRFEELLTDLLEISRFDAGFASLDAEPADVAGIVRRVVDRLDPLAERCGVRIELELPDTAVIAEVDSRRVERILRNLLGNAIEHGEGHPVRIALGADETAIAVTVRDHGVGLRPGEEKLVFNRFWRADPSRARQTGGTGLGLSISVEDARLHGGWLEAWGSPAEGAQFRLTLPVRAGERLRGSPLRLVPDDARTDARTDARIDTRADARTPVVGS
jgi:two-component system sensor histidine kinase MtrB